VNVKININLRNYTLRQAENLHLAAPLFSLSEIVIPPELLSSPSFIEPSETPTPLDITEYVLPYTPDYPEISATYGWPIFTLAEALTGGANLMVTGRPGSGKTVALAHLAIEIAKGKPLPGNINQLIPLLFHTADILLLPKDLDNILNPLIDILTRSNSGVKEEHVITFLEKSIEKHRLLLLIDGLDELPPEQFQIVADYLNQLLEEYPSLRAVVTAPVGFYDGLTALGFIPVAIAAWDDRKRTQFINRWSNLWIKFVGKKQEDAEPIDPVLLNAWLFNDKSTQTPLEQTLKVWATYAGDTLGPNPNDAIEAYIRRMIVNVSNSRYDLERIAIKSLISAQPIFSFKEATDWLNLTENIDDKAVEIEDNKTLSPEENSAAKDNIGKVKPSELLSTLAENGFLKIHQNSILSFSNPIIHSYLAGCIDNAHIYSDYLLKNTNWMTASYSFGYVATQSQLQTTITEYIDQSKEPLQEELLTAARWLRDSPENLEWYGKVMRRLANLLQNDSLPLGIRGRALAAITNSKSTGINVLLSNLITSNDPNTRQLAALGAGQIQDVKIVSNLTKLFNDPVPNVRRAACLALVAIGNSPALEAVAEALLRGDDDLRRMAAEALSNNYEEGYPTLKEGAALDDLLVRRSVVYGLQRVNETWSNKILEHLQLKDEQWVVKTAATQALEELSLPNPHTPHKLPPLTETPWLISFAGERGIGVAPGKPARDLLLLALREGNEEQQLAALNFLSLRGDSTSISEILNFYTNNKGELREAAFNTLWHQAAIGNKMQVTQ
jgi:HEAT repeat protein